jgi:hypothetical protein
MESNLTDVNLSEASSFEAKLTESSITDTNLSDAKFTPKQFKFIPDQTFETYLLINARLNKCDLDNWTQQFGEISLESAQLMKPFNHGIACSIAIFAEYSLNISVPGSKLHNESIAYLETFGITPIKYNPSWTPRFIQRSRDAACRQYQYGLPDIITHRYGYIVGEIPYISYDDTINALQINCEKSEMTMEIKDNFINIGIIDKSAVISFYIGENEQIIYVSCYTYGVGRDFAWITQISNLLKEVGINNN